MKNFLILLAVVLLGCGKPSEPASASKSASATAPAAKPKPAPVPVREIQGAVFVTQKNGESVKLGSIVVRAYTADVADASLKRIHDAYIADRTRNESLALTNFAVANELQGKIDKIDSDRRSLNNQRQQLADNLVALQRDRQYQAGNPVKVQLYQQISTNYANLTATVTKMNDESLALGKQRDERQDTAMKVGKAATDKAPDKFTKFARTAEWPEPIGSTTSDADGKFVLKLEGAGPFKLVAFGQRSVFTKVEHYFWLADVPPNESTMQLNNQNLYDE